MGIQKQDYYEGAALYTLLRSDVTSTIRYKPPYFVLNDNLLILLKYSARGRSPWGFTFMPDEQRLLQGEVEKSKIVLGLICGADGVVALHVGDYFRVAPLRPLAVHLACYRKHGEHYEVSGPDGSLQRKISPSEWRRLSEQNRDS